MLYDYIHDTLEQTKNYRIEDLTAVYAVRLNEHNPWVLERLKLIGSYYAPTPKILIVDFGSSQIFSDQLRLACEENSFEYRYLEDHGVFSAAIARNHGFSHVDTELVFFNDIDCFSNRSLFKELIDSANKFELSKYFNRMINLPVYHLTEDATDKFHIDNGVDYFCIDKIFNSAVFSNRWNVTEFIAPYSNVFLCRSDFFNYSGGYNERFRGHGSEDFEYLIRYSLDFNRYPIPAEIDKDFYAPTRESFYKDLRRYKGFRAIFEAFTLEAELSGLRVGHLWHPKPEASDWIKSNDWKRDTFNEETALYLKDRKRVLECDWLPRRHKVLALVKHEDHINYFLPLRLCGYQFEVFDVNNQDQRVQVMKKIDSGYFDAVCMFNPYMKSHSDLYVYFEYARKSGIKPIIIERGALPESWYYAEDMAYVDSDYQSLDIDSIIISDERLVDGLIGTIKSGGVTLEDNGAFDATYFKYRFLRFINKKIIFIPLQLSDDSAVTRFCNGYMTYEEYIEDLRSVLASRDDVIFLIKKHPLNALNDLDGVWPENVFICDADDNVHALIESSDALACYNSGVGLLGLIHNKPVYTFGCSFYSSLNLGLGIQVRTLSEVIERVVSNMDIVDNYRVKKFLTWLIFYKYSFYKSDTVMRDFGERRSHGYRNSRFYLINYEGFRIDTRILARDQPYGNNSYGAAKLRIPLSIEQYRKDVQGNSKATGGVSAREKGAIPSKGKGSGAVAQSARVSAGQSTGGKASQDGVFFRKIRKLLRDPKGFFADSKHPILRRLG